jgi:hypothetical protein
LDMALQSEEEIHVKVNTDDKHKSWMWDKRVCNRSRKMTSLV